MVKDFSLYHDSNTISEMHHKILFYISMKTKKFIELAPKQKHANLDNNYMFV
jgi:hypothetical protein